MTILKLIVAIVDPEKTEGLVDAARQAGATGATIVTNARGEGMLPKAALLGLQLDAQRDVVFFVVSADRADAILTEIERVCEMNHQPESGIAFTVDVDRAVGLRTQLPDT